MAFAEASLDLVQEPCLTGAVVATQRDNLRHASCGDREDLPDNPELVLASDESPEGLGGMTLLAYKESRHGQRR